MDQNLLINFSETSALTIFVPVIFPYVSSNTKGRGKATIYIIYVLLIKTYISLFGKVFCKKMYI